MVYSFKEFFANKMLAVALVALGLSSFDPARLRRRDFITTGALGASTVLTGRPLDSASAAATAAPGTLKGSFEVPPVGLGTWAWGDSIFWKYDPMNDGQLREVFDYAVEQGILFWDTAELYGLGRSESLLGKFSAGNPNIQIATKFAALPWRTKAFDVVEAAKRSTDRLGRPIDLYQIHFPNAWANEAYWDGLAKCVESGLIRSAGVSNYGSEAVRACHGVLAARGVPLVSNQIQLSLLYPYPLQNGLKDTCDSLGVRTIAYSPLALGILTGKYSDTNLPDGPRRAVAEKALADPAFPRLLAAMRAVGQAHGGATPAEVAIAWCAAKGASVIPGARTISQAKSDLAAANLALSSAEVASLDAASSQITPVIAPEASPFPKKDLFTKMTMFDS
jgi:pyridoxine 4-dehydrogenase